MQVDSNWQGHYYTLKSYTFDKEVLELNLFTHSDHPFKCETPRINIKLKGVKDIAVEDLERFVNRPNIACDVDYSAKVFKMDDDGAYAGYLVAAFDDIELHGSPYTIEEYKERISAELQSNDSLEETLKSLKNKIRLFIIQEKYVLSKKVEFYTAQGEKDLADLSLDHLGIIKRLEDIYEVYV